VSFEVTNYGIHTHTHQAKISIPQADKLTSVSASNIKQQKHNKNEIK